MSTSVYEGILDFDAALYGTDDDFEETVLVGDGLANGLLHCADEIAQVRVNYMAPAAAIAQDQDEFETIETSPTASQWYRVGGSPFGPWPLTLRADGTPYKLRIRLGVAASASNATTLTVRVVVCPLDEVTAVEERDRDTDRVYEVAWTASDTGTSPTWLVGESQGDAASETVITVDRESAFAWTQRVPTYDAVSAASPTTVQQVLVAAHVWAKTSSTGTLPRLQALHLAEYIGL